MSQAPPTPSPPAGRNRDGADLAELDRLLGDVLIEGELARTASAALYRIRIGAPPGRRRILKVAHQPVDDDELARLEHEVGLLRPARHPNVVEVDGFGVLTGGYPFFTLEPLRLADLEAYLARGGWGAFYHLAMGAAAGLAHLHGQGVLHLNLKPANLGVVEAGGAGEERAEPGGAEAEPQIKLLDFGLGRAPGTPDPLPLRGEVAYAAPEVVLEDDFDERADLYSLGMVLLHLATGGLPSGGDAKAALRFHLAGETPDVHQLRPDLPAPLARILRRLLQHEARRRPASARQLLAELAAAAGTPLPAAAEAGGDGAGRAGGEALPRRLTSPMVGRGEALERLRDELAAARRGEGRLLLVAGDEGSGKSRLLAELRRLARLEGATVVAADGRSGQPQLEHPILAALATLDPPTTVPPTAAGTDRAAFRRDVAARVARAAAAASPLVLMVDDADLAAREARELLIYLATEVGRQKVLLLASRRGGETAPGDPLRGAPTLSLPPLDRASLAALAGACLGVEEPPAAFVAALERRSGGGPALCRQLLHRLLDDGVLTLPVTDWDAAIAALERTPAQEEGLDALLQDRLAALEPAARRALEAAAVLGTPLRPTTLAALLEEPPAQTYGRLRSLTRQGLMDRRRRGARELFSPATRPLAEVVYSALGAAQRDLLHRRSAEVLETEGAAAVPAVAEHRWRGGERVPSLRHQIDAAEWAAAVGLFHDASLFSARAAEAAREEGDAELEGRMLEAEARALAAGGEDRQALRLLRALSTELPQRQRRAADRRHRARLLLERARLELAASDPTAAVASCQAALAELADGGERPLEIDLLLTTAAAQAAAGESREAFATARAALARTGADGDAPRRARALERLAALDLAAGRRRRGERLLRRGLRAAEEAGADELAAGIRRRLAPALLRCDAHTQAAEFVERNLAAARTAHDPWRLMRALGDAGWLERHRGGWRQAREALAEHAELQRLLGSATAEAEAQLALGHAEEVLGHGDAAQCCYRRAVELAGETRPATEGLLHLACLERKRGNAAAAERLARQTLERAAAAEQAELAAHAHAELGLLAADRDDRATAGEHLHQSLALSAGDGAAEVAPGLHLSLAVLALRCGDRRAGQEEAQRARHRAGETGDRFARAQLAVVEARLATLAGNPEAAEHGFAAGVQTLEEMGAPYELAQGLYEWGVHTPNAELALDRLRQALDLFEELNAATDAGRTRGAIERIRAGRDRHAEPAAEALFTGIIQALASGGELGARLQAALRLVASHLEAERGLIALFDPLTGEAEAAATYHVGGAVVTVEEPQVADLLQSCQEEQRTVAARPGGAAARALCLPLPGEEPPAGALYLARPAGGRPFGEAEAEALGAVAAQLALAVANARLAGELEAARRGLHAPEEAPRPDASRRHHLGSLIGVSRAMAELKHTLERVAQRSSTVLIRGESGTGKGLVARILHAISPRAEGPFIHFNCAALPETLVESELFGHEKGAFTGAAVQKPGRFELAHGGTIFLDEVGKISMAVQAKLLRVVEDKAFERVGGVRTLRKDVRIIAATNLEMEEAIADGSFREDLYYRLNIIPIVLPPLRQRREDIPALAEHFVAELARELGVGARTLGPDVLDLFLHHDWPGNVRELESAIHRALVMSQTHVLTAADFAWIGRRRGGEPPGTAPPPPATAPLAEGDFHHRMGSYERQLIAAALEQSDGRVREAARLLGIARNTLKSKMRRYGL